jgi:predicted DNA-binding protein with PD1-like motif
MFIGKLSYKSDLLRELNKLAAKQNIPAGAVQVMGSLSRARLSFFDQKIRAYRELDFDAPHEIVAGTGNISVRNDDGVPSTHLHLAVADSQGNVVGGHCLEGCTVFAVEFVIWPFHGLPPRRSLDHATGLLLWEQSLYGDDRKEKPIRPGLDNAD